MLVQREKNVGKIKVSKTIPYIRITLYNQPITIYFKHESVFNKILHPIINVVNSQKNE